ncbi:hypothetical protein FOA52_005358 [Chlamydomonas sp. UWO 241]|nr:hypothetical protein FOA52_005358 [Chlamydomonas sp. UWO 241]
MTMTKHRPGPTLALLALLAAISISCADGAITVPIGGPLKAVPRVWLKKIGDTLDILQFPDNITIDNNRPASAIAVEWLSPQWQTSFNGVTFTTEVHAPALTLATPTWRFALTNLPFQKPCSCGCTAGTSPDPNYCQPCVDAADQIDPPPENNILGIYNGFHNSMYTNIHTHGLKVDVDLDNLTAFDPCEPAIESAGLDLCSIPEGNFTMNDFAGTPTAAVDCPIFSENVYASVVSGASKARNTYILPAQVPGVHWLFAPKTMTGHFMDYNGIRDWRDWNNGHDDADVYTKKNAWRQYMRDYDADNVQNVANNVGLDWVALNGAIQPTLTLTEKKYSRWQMVNTMTMKWLELTIAPLPTPNGDGTATVRLLTPRPRLTARCGCCPTTGVYLEHIPRLPKTSSDGNVTIFNDIILGNGTRADVLVKCNTTDRYGFYSGAGPLSTVPECLATHCELFGSEINENGARISPRVAGLTGNSYFDGADIFPTLLAVIEVEELCGGDGGGIGGGMGGGSEPLRDSVPDDIPACAMPTPCSPYMSHYYCTAPGTLANATEQGQEEKEVTPAVAAPTPVAPTPVPVPAPAAPSRAMFPPPPSPPPPPPRQCILDPELSDEMCRTRLELFSYTDYPNWVADPALEQTSSPTVCLTQGSAQDWNYSGFAFHPIHLHETPVRFNIKPKDVVSTDFFTTVFPPVPVDFDTMSISVLKNITVQYLTAYNSLQNSTSMDIVGNCADRYSVAHCHVLAHEDEGCMVVVWWKCPTVDVPTCAIQTQCVYTDTPGLLI